MHVNYSFFKFLGVGLLRVATSLEAGLHWWQTACIPRPVQWLMYLVKRRNMMLKSPNLLEVSCAYAGIECQSWTAAPRPADPNLPLTGKEHEPPEVTPLARGYTVRRSEPWSPDSLPQALSLTLAF